MKKLIFILLFLPFISFASIVGASFNKQDLKILEDLDIDSMFITDYELQKIYNNLLKKSKNRYVSGLNNASLFIPKIKEILKKEGVPAPFLYLAMAESNFELDAKSFMSATGLWQFMPQTAQRFGLQKSVYVDERMDLVKSTHAAAKYLKHLHTLFDKWYLAVIAYNCGEGRVIEGLTRATIDMYVEQNPHLKRSKKILQYRRTIRAYQHKRLSFSHVYKIYKQVKNWNIQPGIDKLLFVQKNLSRQYIPSESRKYIRKIISFGLMGNKTYLVNDGYLLNQGVGSPIATIKLKGGTHLRNVAKLLGIEYKFLKSLNMHIQQNIIPPTREKYHVYIPYSKLSRYNANKHNIKSTRFAMHTVKPGETLGKIGAKYKISYKLIKEYNNLSSNIINIDQKLIIPIDPAKMPKKPMIYKVKAGDTLAHIAQKYEVKLSKLMGDNQIKSSLIKVGEELVINFN